MRLRFLGTSTDVGISKSALGWLLKMASILALMRLIGRRIFSGDQNAHSFCKLFFFTLIICWPTIQRTSYTWSTYFMLVGLRSWLFWQISFLSRRFYVTYPLLFWFWCIFVHFVGFFPSDLPDEMKRWVMNMNLLYFAFFSIRFKSFRFYYYII